MRTIILFVLACACTPALAQWVPVTATETTTIDVTDSAGKLTSHRVAHDRYFRSQSGSILVQHLSGPAGDKLESATLLDYGNTGKAYAIAYNDLAVMEKGRALAPAFPRTRADIRPEYEKNILGRESLQGIECLILPVYSYDRQTRSERLSGRVWVAPDFNFVVLKEDSTEVSPDGSLVHIVKEKKHVRIDVEPDRVLFSTDKQSLKQALTLPPPTEE